jgi:hypothetical protein
MTYGQANNDLAWVLKQRALGILGVITDDPATMVRGTDELEDPAGGSPTSVTSQMTELNLIEG